MKSGLFNTVISAVVGGVVGAVVAFACGAFSAPDFPDSVEKLKVGELVVADKMMLWEDGKENFSLLIQNGGVLASTRVIATQVCGNAMLANIVLTTPDNPVNPLDQCEIFTEMGSSKTEGGLLTVRSPDGGNVLSKQGVNSGWAYTVAYDNQANPVCFLRRNDTGFRALGQFKVPPAPAQENAANPNAGPGAQPMEMSQHAPTGAPMNPATANPNPGMPAPVAPAPGNPNAGGEQSAMIPPVAR